MKSSKSSSGGRRAASLPATFITPMKALATDIVPRTDDGAWHCEIKFDGYRALAVINRGSVVLWSRNHKPLDYPEVLPPLKKLRCTSAVLDGEIVALDESGRSDFQTLQGRDVGERPPIIYYVFDLLFLNGHDTTALPIEERRALLEKLVGKTKRPLLLSPTFDVQPAVFLQQARRQGLEGMILKKAASAYEPGHRSGSWLKIKNGSEQEFVIGGFTPPQNTRQHFGAILVGYYENKKLLYAGKVGSGYTGKLLALLAKKFARLTTERCPFANLPLSHRSRFGSGMSPAVMRTVTWLKPRLVAQIKFAEWTDEGILRQPVFLGLRTDKAAREVGRDIDPPARSPTRR